MRRNDLGFAFDDGASGAMTSIMRPQGASLTVAGRGHGAPAPVIGFGPLSDGDASGSKHASITCSSLSLAKPITKSHAIGSWSRNERLTTTHLAPSSVVGLHLKLLATVSRLLKDDAFRQAFADAADQLGRRVLAMNGDPSTLRATHALLLHAQRAALQANALFSADADPATATAALGHIELHRVFKPLTMLIAIVFVVGQQDPMRAGGRFSSENWLLAGALAASLAGDVFLMFPGFFIPGLVSFLVAHLLYIALFHRDAPWFPSRGALVATLDHRGMDLPDPGHRARIVVGLL